ncbi:hypothetical protein GDO86_012930, partial [Hymenochirus boettgeri]
MGTSFFWCITFIFYLVVMKIRGSPAYSSILSSDLTDLKSLLERLEDKGPPEEPAVPPQDLYVQNFEAAESYNSAPSWTGEEMRPQSDIVNNRGSSWETADKISKLKSKLREILNSPRSMRRSSDCFGARIDRIGAQSGMGCNSRR